MVDGIYLRYFIRDYSHLQFYVLYRLSIGAVNIEKIEDILQAYSLEEILELNDLSTADVLYFLVEEEFLELPNPEPL